MTPCPHDPIAALRRRLRTEARAARCCAGAILLSLLVASGCRTTRAPAPASRPTTASLLADAQIARRLRGHVEILAAHIGPRNLDNPPNLAAAATYIETMLRQHRYQPAALTFTARGKSLRIIDAEIPGAGPDHEIVLLGAHYDSAPGSPGANGNASGVAAVLEAAQLLKDCHPQRTIRFVFFVNDEPPAAGTPQMGSRLYAQRCKDRGEKIVAMLNLDSVGYYTDAKGSQHYPFPFGLMRPSVGNFVAIVSNFASRDLLHRTVASFNAAAPLPVQADAVPESVAGLDTSAQWWFWKAGYPALLISDTADSRYPHDAKPTDTPEKLDYPRLTQLVTALVRATRDLAGASK